MYEMGEPYKSGVELLSFHTVSKVRMNCTTAYNASHDSSARIVDWQHGSTLSAHAGDHNVLLPAQLSLHIDCSSIRILRRAVLFVLTCRVLVVNVVCVVAMLSSATSTLRRLKSCTRSAQSTSHQTVSDRYAGKSSLGTSNR